MFFNKICDTSFHKHSFFPSIKRSTFVHDKKFVTKFARKTCYNINLLICAKIMSKIFLKVVKFASILKKIAFV